MVGDGQDGEGDHEDEGEEGLEYLEVLEAEEETHEEEESGEVEEVVVPDEPTQSHGFFIESIQHDRSHTLLQRTHLARLYSFQSIDDPSHVEELQHETGECEARKEIAEIINEGSVGLHGVVAESPEADCEIVDEGRVEDGYSEGLELSRSRNPKQDEDHLYEVQNLKVELNQ